MHAATTKSGRLWPLVSVCFLTALLMLACPPRQNQNVTLDEESAASATIGPEGGVIAAIAGDGTEYMLDVPANALAEHVDITITPVTGIRNLPLSGGFAGAVDLQPAGLEFARSATLTITGAPGVPSGMVPIGFSYEGDADTLDFAIAAADEGVLTVLLQHFSGGGVGFGTLQDVSTLSFGGFQGCDVTLLDNLLALTGTPHTPQVEVSRFREIFVQCILPNLQNAANDAELNQAVGKYDLWANVISPALGFTVNPGTSSEFAAERQQAAAAAAEKIRAAIAANNAVAAAQLSFTAVANVLFWQEQAQLFDMDLQAEQLSRETVLLSIPLDIQMEPVTLPATIQDGFPHSLDLQFSVVFHGDSIPNQAPFQVSLTATGATLQNPSGFTAADGSYTTVITATGAGDVGVSIEACLVLPVAPPEPPAQPTATDLCFHDFVGAASVNLTGQWRGTLVIRDVLSGEVASVEVTFLLSQNQNAITGTFDGGFNLVGTVSATLITNTLGELELVGLVFTVTEEVPLCASPVGEFSGGHAFVVGSGTTMTMTGNAPTASGCIARIISAIISFSVIGPTPVQ